MKTKTKTTPTPAPRPPGRPRVAEARRMRGLRLTAEEWATLQALGGADWLRDRLRRARLSDEQHAVFLARLAEECGQGARLRDCAP